ncbi:MAG: hypothetical protein RLZZ50_336 [Verrucomicrobiota bacterium]
MNELRLEIPRLNPMPFIVADATLLVVAALIGWMAPAPISPLSLAAIAVCVATGAVALLYPFVVNHARRQEEALQERTNQIEALARTVSASAEQISIAVSNLPAIAENSARQLKAAEQLPAALNTQLAALQGQLSAAANEENAGLRQELDALRNAENAKLAQAMDGLIRATADLARLEKLAAQQSAALDQALAQLPRLVESLGQQAGEALSRETAAAVKALNAATTEGGNALASATAEARVAFDRSVRDAVTHLATQSISTPPFPAHQPNRAIVAPEPALQSPPPAPPAPAPAEVEPILTSEPEPIIDDAGLDEPAAAPAATEIAEDTEAVIEESAETSDLDVGSAAVETVTPAEPAPEPETEPEDAAPPASDEPEAEAAPTPAEPALSHDGYTRLIATAYIGIGNKLFIRGDGPGLRRDKGVPLQFVSIGKWRWESAELLFPVKIRLYKNDQIECTALGEITLEPGHHHEVNAAF